MTTNRTQVAIIGAGPSGLLLGQLLHKAGIDNVILERQSGDYVLGRIRAGILEQVTMDLLRRGRRGRRRGPRRHWCTTASSWCSAARATAIDVHGLTGGKVVTAYGQTELTRDLMDARAAAGLTTVYEAADVALHDFDGAKPRVTYQKDGQTHTLDCDFIAGCDGFHGVCRASVPRRRSASTRRSTPSAGWACWPTCRRCAELVYGNSERGFSLCSHAQPDAQPLLRAVPADDKVEQWSDDAFWDELRCRLDPKARARDHRPQHRKEHRPAAQLCGRAHALWPPVPGGRRRPHRAAHRRQGPEPGGHRRQVPVRRPGRALPRAQRGGPGHLLGQRPGAASGAPSASPGGSPR
jgi:p-hydroxybenzoate 3-monooxygenase